MSTDRGRVLVAAFLFLYPVCCLDDRGKDVRLLKTGAIKDQCVKTYSGVNV